MSKETEKLDMIPENNGWQPDSWQSRQAQQQASYPDEEELQATLAELADLPATFNLQSSAY